MDLRTLSELVPKRTNDHRDYYLLASLIKNGYLDLPIENGIGANARPWHDLNEITMAINLFMWVRAECGGEFHYQGIRMDGGDHGTQPVFATAKADLLLDEIASKRQERMWTLGIGAAIALLAALFTYLAEKIA